MFGTTWKNIMEPGINGIYIIISNYFNNSDERLLKKISLHHLQKRIIFSNAFPFMMQIMYCITKMYYQDA